MATDYNALISISPPTFTFGLSATANTAASAASASATTLFGALCFFQPLRGTGWFSAQRFIRRGHQRCLRVISTDAESQKVDLDISGLMSVKTVHFRYVVAQLCK